MKAMAHNVDDRYPTATHMLADMEEFRKDSTIVFPYVVDSKAQADRESKASAAQSDSRTGEKPARGKKTAFASGNQSKEAQRRKEAQRKQEAKRIRKQKQSREQKRSRIAVIAIVICSLIAAIAIGIFMTILLSGGFTPEQKLVKVPNLVGEKFSELQRYPGLTIVKEELYNETVEAGRVINQRPEAGIEVVEDSNVVVYVSLGPVPHVVKMSNLIERSKDWCDLFLDSLNLKLNVEIREEYNGETPAGHVYRTDPKVGTVLTKGQTITLWVSKGDPIQFSSMPNLLNEEKSVALALLDERKLALEIIIEEVFDFNVKAGHVVETEPAAGDKLVTGQKIKLKVSKGIEKKVMPDLLGMDPVSAEDLLSTIGFGRPTITYEYSDKPVDTVIQQSLKHGEEYEITTPISLVISLGIEKKTLPYVIGMYESEVVDMLHELGFKKITINRIYSSEFIDTVLSLTFDNGQTYEMGKEYEITVGITLQVSMGIEKKLIPDLTGMDVEAAREMLKEMGFDYLYVESVYHAAPAGTILSQTLGNGMEYEADKEYEVTTPIIVKVSNGIEKKVLPDLVGMTLEEAETLLETLGFHADISVTYMDHDEPAGTVIGQSLAKDQEYLPDIKLLLVISNGPVPVVVKDVVIDLMQSAGAGSCYITITRDGNEVFSGTISGGTRSITLRDQEGLGMVVYTITVNNKDSWTVMEEFAFDE